MAARGPVQPVKGTRDFYPQDQSWQNWLYKRASQASRAFGYQEYEGPILESFSLYAAKSSEEIVKNQAFIIPLKGKSVKDSLILRPELTPTLARMVAAKEYQLIFPLRWWSWGRFFRYEAPQKGRGREFYQWNIDLLGQDSLKADAEIIAVGVWFLASLGLTSDDVVIKINDRKYLDSRLDQMNVPLNQRLPIFRIIDKKDKVGKAGFKAMLSEAGLTDSQIKDLNLILENYDYRRQSPWLAKLFSSLSFFGIDDWVEFEPAIVRGFDYYTDTVFEAQTRSGENRSLLGGGRYQNLVGDVGGRRKISGVGLAAGDMMIYEVLSDLGRLPELSSLSAKILLTIFNEETFPFSLQIADKLRKSGINVETYLDPQATLTKQLSYANKKGFDQVLIVGPEEIAAQEVTVKNLLSGRQDRVKLMKLTTFLKNSLTRSEIV